MFSCIDHDDITMCLSPDKVRHLSRQIIGQVFSFVHHNITMYLSPDKVRRSSPEMVTLVRPGMILDQVVSSIDYDDTATCFCFEIWL